MTRRQNGEHEIRIGEWLQAFAAAGFEVDGMVQFAPQVGLKLAVKGLISRLPLVIRRRFVTIPLVPGYPTAWALGWFNGGSLTRRVVPGPKPSTGFAVRKR